ncbi:MAG: hypothetical protein B7Z20_05060 [Sphingobium sp. 32-64-5]|nr:MAG: hypothetical protein B7Z20_05060 [Sphingobium sp. 32-64-5]
MQSLHISMHKSLKAGVATLSLIACAGMAAQAQEKPGSREGTSGVGLADIIVTAQRYEQSLQDTPLSVVALDGQQLAAAGIDSLDKFDTFIPNVSIGGTMAQGSAIASFAIRGIGGAPSHYLAATPPVAPFAT